MTDSEAKLRKMESRALAKYSFWKNGKQCSDNGCYECGACSLCHSCSPPSCESCVA